MTTRFYRGCQRKWKRGRGAPRPSGGSTNLGDSRACPAARGLALQLSRDELLDAVARDIIGDLARRMLHRVRGAGIERTTDLAVAGELEASDGVDHHTARARRVLHRHPQLELDRNPGEALALDAQEPDLLDVLP